MENNLEKLLPCPFCGGKANKYEWKDESLWSHNIVSWFTIGCLDCDYQMNTCGFEKDAIRKWNNRFCWISMETPPKEFKNYLVLTVYGTIKTDEWRQPLGGSWLGVEIITHWMSIFKLPEGLDKTLFSRDPLVI